MNPRSLIRALAALGGLVVLWGAFTLFRGGLSESTDTLLLPALSPPEIERVDLAGAGDTVRLVRVADGWTVNDAAADPGEVDKLLGALSDSATSSELVARNPTSHARMGVDSTGRRVVVRQGDEVLLDLVVGTSGGGYMTAYVRHAGEAEVYRVRGTLGSLVGREADAWRNRRVAGIPADSVGRIAIFRGGSRAVLTRDGDAWRVDGAPADTSAVRRLLGALADITAIGFASPGEIDSLDFGKPDRRLTVESRGADTLLDLLVDSIGAGFRARTSTRADVFQLDFWRVNELIPSLEALRPSGS